MHSEVLDLRPHCTYTSRSTYAVRSTYHRQGGVRGRQAQGHHHRGVRALSVWEAANLQRTTAALLVACQPQYRRVAGLGCRSRLNGTVPTTLRLGFWKDHVAKHETQCDPPRFLQSRSVSLETRVYASSVTRLLTLVSLGENLSNRAYASNDLINPLASKRY